MASHTSHSTVDKVIAPAQTKEIWKVFYILLALTAFEFLIAFTMERGMGKTWIFVGMTLVKAFYIVGYFMHLKHEVKFLIKCLLFPTIFIVWLMIILFYEGGHHNLI